MEKLTLAAPDVTPAVQNTGWEPGGLLLDWKHDRLVITLYGDNGEQKTETVEGPVATSLMRTLNVANLSTKSLHKRVIEWLIANRGYTGSVSGAPD